jgi:hypothetical protein
MRDQWVHLNGQLKTHWSNPQFSTKLKLLLYDFMQLKMTFIKHFNFRFDQDFVQEIYTKLFVLFWMNSKVLNVRRVEPTLWNYICT